MPQKQDGEKTTSMGVLPMSSLLANRHLGPRFLQNIIQTPEQPTVSTDPNVHSLSQPVHVPDYNALTTAKNGDLPIQYPYDSSIQYPYDSSPESCSQSITQPIPHYATSFSFTENGGITFVPIGETRNPSKSQNMFMRTPMPDDDLNHSKIMNDVGGLDLYPEAFQRMWDNSSPSPLSRGSSSLKPFSPRTRTRITPRNHHHYYLDSLLRSKCPKDRLPSLEVAIQFRNDHSPLEPIPNEFLDELLEATDGDKYYCYCCPRAKKPRTITPARDHVRKSLGNYPFQCPNSWCRHSSLRQADLNKHIKTCINAALSHV